MSAVILESPESPDQVIQVSSSIKPLDAASFETEKRAVGGVLLSSCSVSGFKLKNRSFSARSSSRPTTRRQYTQSGDGGVLFMSVFNPGVGEVGVRASLCSWICIGRDVLPWASSPSLFDSW
jgi:hypothetical protein